MKRNLKEVRGKNPNRRTEITYEVERMDESAIFDEIPCLHGIFTIDVAVDGWEGPVFTWGDLAVRRIKDNRTSDGALNREKSAEATVPNSMSCWRYGGRAERKSIRIGGRNEHIAGRAENHASPRKG